MATVVSDKVTTQVVLSDPSQDPLTVTSTGDIETTIAAVVAGQTNEGFAWTITNSGTVQNSQTIDAVGFTVSLEGKTNLTNKATGLITGEAGIGAVSTSEITNNGTIEGLSGAAIDVSTSGAAGSTISNGVDGNTTAQIRGSAYGVTYFGSEGQVTNNGIITGRLAVNLDDGGKVANGGPGESSALIEGSFAGVAIGGTQAGTVDNSGTITGVMVGVQSDPVATINNAGTISGTSDASASYGVLLTGGGDVSNGVQGATTAKIVGNRYGIFSSSSSALGTDVDNEATITGISGAGTVIIGGGQVNNGIDNGAALIEGLNQGVLISGTSGSVTNLGTIRGGIGVALSAGGTLRNGTSDATSALISGDQLSVNADGPTTIINAGTLQGDVELSDGAGTIENTGLIKGDIAFFGGAGTLDNSGMVEGSIRFAQGFSNRLVDNPGAVFTALVDGGGQNGGSATLELASGRGEISGIGTAFKNFSDIEVDRAGSWEIAGANSLSAGQTLTNQGVVTVTGTVTGNGAIANSGELTSVVGQSATITVDRVSNEQEIIAQDRSELTLNGALTGTGLLTVGAGATVVLNGYVDVAQNLMFAGDNGTLEFLRPAEVEGTVSGFDAGDVIDLVGIGLASSASLARGNVLVITGGSGDPVRLQLNPSLDYSGSVFTLSADGKTGVSAGTDIVVQGHSVLQ